MQEQGPVNNMNDFGLFHNQDAKSQLSLQQTDNFRWHTQPIKESTSDDKETVDNVLDRSGLLDELVSQILDDGTTPVEDKPSQNFRDAVNAKEFVPTGQHWSFENPPSSSSLQLNTNAAITTTNRGPPAPPMTTELLNMGQQQQQDVRGSSATDVQTLAFKGKYITSTGKVINPPPGFEQDVQPSNNIQTKPPLSDIDILRNETLSSNMFSPAQSISGNQPISSNMATLNMALPNALPDTTRLDYHQRPPFQASHMAQSLFQRRTNSPFQMALSETGSGSSPGSIDSSPILSPNSPFDTNMSMTDTPTVQQAKSGATRFNFKAPPFFPARHSPSPLGWRGQDNGNTFKYIRSESPVEPRQDQNIPFGNIEPPPMNRMLRGNFPLQTLPLQFGGNKPMSSPQDIPGFRNSHANFLQQQRNNNAHQQPKPFYNSNSGRNSPFPYQQQNQQPAMGPHGDSYSSYNRYGQTQQATYSGFKQQGFPGAGGSYQKFPDTGNMFSMQHQQVFDVESPTGKLHQELDECCIHVKRLEEERKKTEYDLARMHPGKRISSSNTIQAPQLPDNPSQVDRIIVDVYKEHSRLMTLMSKIEGLCTKSLHPNLEACLDNWMTIIQEVEARRQQEIRNTTKRQQQDQNSSSLGNDEEVTQLVNVIEKMKAAIRAARTALWSAFQMAKQDKKDKENKETVVREG